MHISLSITFPAVLLSTQQMQSSQIIQCSVKLCKGVITDCVGMAYCRC